ncbi:MAG: cupin domain-containing protein [Ornithinimicrobium sp.]
MDSLSLATVADEQIAAARDTSSGRSATTVHGGHEHSLRQTVIALTAGHGLGEHDSPGEATLQVLTGRVRLIAGDQSHEASTGDYLIIPPVRHHLDAIEDSAVLLTVAVAGPQ